MTRGLAKLAARALAMAKLSPEDPELMPPARKSRPIARCQAAYRRRAGPLMGPNDRAAVRGRARNAIAHGRLRANVQIAGFFERTSGETAPPPRAPGSRRSIARPRRRTPSRRVRSTALDRAGRAGTAGGGRRARSTTKRSSRTAIEKGNAPSANAKALLPVARKYTRHSSSRRRFLPEALAVS